jgi:hypothetical protein
MRVSSLQLFRPASGIENGSLRRVTASVKGDEGALPPYQKATWFAAAPHQPGRKTTRVMPAETRHPDAENGIPAFAGMT